MAQTSKRIRTAGPLADQAPLVTTSEADTIGSGTGVDRGFPKDSAAPPDNWAGWDDHGEWESLFNSIQTSSGDGRDVYPGASSSRKRRKYPVPMLQLTLIVSHQVETVHLTICSTFELQENLPRGSTPTFRS